MAGLEAYCQRFTVARTRTFPTPAEPPSSLSARTGSSAAAAGRRTLIASEMRTDRGPDLVSAPPSQKGSGCRRHVNVTIGAAALRLPEMAQRRTARQDADLSDTWPHACLSPSTRRGLWPPRQLGSETLYQGQAWHRFPYAPRPERRPQAARSAPNRGGRRNRRERRGHGITYQREQKY